MGGTQRKQEKVHQRASPRKSTMPASRRRRADPWKTRRAREFRRVPTPAEGALWAALRRRQLQGLRFRRQAVLYGWIVDFYCPALKLVVEVDGTSHLGSLAPDERRDAELARRGFATLRVANEDVLTEMPRVLASIATEAQRLGRGGGHAAPRATAASCPSRLGDHHVPPARAVPGAAAFPPCAPLDDDGDGDDD
ncbi:MAG: endonuclease domain-containing protein [Halobacteriales archaeon]|nr:endonuclease domain-containing protein [Halobacteriales archaeon]